MSGRDLCCMSAMKYPRNFCGVISCAVHMLVVGCNALLFRFPDFVTCAGNSFLYLLSGTMLISAPESTLIGIGLHPCLVIICNMVWKEVCPSDAKSAGRLNSVQELDDLLVRWLIWYVQGDEVLWLCVGCDLLLVIGFLGVLDLPFKMFNSCWKAVIMGFACSGAHCPND